MEKTTFKIAQEHDEYQVQVFEDGEQNHDRTYFTDDVDDAIETFKAMVEEEERNQAAKEYDPEEIEKARTTEVLPSDNLETALDKVGFHPRMIKAIIKGYEGTGLNNPIAEKDNFYIKDLLLKTAMVWNETYTSWEDDLFFNANKSNLKRYKAGIKKILKAAQNEFVNLKEITERIKLHKRQGHEIVRLMAYHKYNGNQTINDIFEFTVISEDSPTCFTKAGELRAPIKRMIQTSFAEMNTEWFEIEVANYEGRH